MSELKNWIKLEVLLNRATGLLRDLFFTRWKLTHGGNEWVNCEETGQKFITGIGQCVYDKVNITEKNLLGSGEVSRWDLTTLVHVLGMTPFPKIGDNDFEKRVKEENCKIRQLAVNRNRIVHHASKVITDPEFNELWDKVSQVLVQLGDSSTELNQLKTRGVAKMLKDSPTSGKTSEPKKTPGTSNSNTGNGTGGVKNKGRPSTSQASSSNQTNLSRRSQSYSNLYFAAGMNNANGALECSPDVEPNRSRSRNTRVVANVNRSQQTMANSTSQPVSSPSGQLNEPRIKKQTRSRSKSRNRKKCNLEASPMNSNNHLALAPLPLEVQALGTDSNQASRASGDLNDIGTKKKNASSLKNQAKSSGNNPGASLQTTSPLQCDATWSNPAPEKGEEDSTSTAALPKEKVEDGAPKSQAGPMQKNLKKKKAVAKQVHGTDLITEQTLAHQDTSSVDSFEPFLCYNSQVIDEYVLKGSLAALNIQVAINSARKALVKFNEIQVGTSTRVNRVLGAQFVLHLAHAIRTDDTVLKLPTELREKMETVTRRLWEAEGQRKSQVDINARLCFSYLSSGPLVDVVAFLKQCSLKYGTEPCFRHRCGRLLGMLGQFEDGLAELNAAMLLPDFTKRDDLMYDRAAMMRLMGCNKIDPYQIVQAFKEFLDCAPIDHPRLPKSYYAMAAVELKIGDSSHLLNGFGNLVSAKARELYVRGLRAEQDQLRFFLPYQCKDKTFLEIHFATISGTLSISEPHPHASLPSLI